MATLYDKQGNTVLDLGDNIVNAISSAVNLRGYQPTLGNAISSLAYSSPRVIHTGTYSYTKNGVYTFPNGHDSQGIFFISVAGSNYGRYLGVVVPDWNASISVSTIFKDGINVAVSGRTVRIVSEWQSLGNTEAEFRIIKIPY